MNLQLRRPLGVPMLLGGILLLAMTALQQLVPGGSLESSSIALWTGLGGLLMTGLSVVLLRPTRQDFALLAVSALASLIVMEVGLRTLSTTDIDGQVWIFSTPLRPLRLPAEGHAESLETYKSADNVFRIYDPLLGWTNAANATSWQGYQTNTDGLRGLRDYDRQPADGTIRIALFGDSFTFGEDVTEDESWGFLIEQDLRRQGYSVEVLNFGVSAYGIDQAYLRYHEVGRDFSPDIVILGFQPENMRRNINILRSLYTYGLRPVFPFTKPRFVLHDGELQLVNSPAIPADRIVETVRSFDTSPLAPYEFFYRPELYANHWWLKSRLIALIVTLAGDPTRSPAYTTSLYDPQGEMLTLTTAIVDQMADEAAADGALFAVVHLPRARELEAIRMGQPLLYQSVIDDFDQHHLYIETAQAFTHEPASDYFLPHYTPEGNQLIAQAVVDTLLPYLPQP